MRTSRSVALGAVMAAVVATSVSGNTRLDYVAQRARWTVLGWTGTAYVTCGITNTLAVNQLGHFGIFRQVWQPSRLFLGKDGLVSWNMEVGTLLRAGTPINLAVAIDDKFLAVFPAISYVDATVDHGRGVVSLSTQSCAPEPGCADAPESAIMRAIVVRLAKAKSLVFTLRYNGGKETLRVDVSGLRKLNEELAACFSTIGFQRSAFYEQRKSPTGRHQT